MAGFATYGVFRPWRGFKYTVEDSLFVRRENRRAGLGKALLAELLRLAEERGCAAMVAGMDSQNAASRRLHEGLGFFRAGIIRRAGYKFGSWLDLVFYERLLSGPERPVEE